MPPQVHALTTWSATFPERSTICQSPCGGWTTSERIQLVPSTTESAASALPGPAMRMLSRGTPSSAATRTQYTESRWYEGPRRSESPPA